MTRKDFIKLIENTFHTFGLKIVSNTDKNKSAYVPNMNQKKVFEALNINPFERRQDIQVKELFSNNILHISYYGTLRNGSGRSPELRMGLHDLINYFEVGDELLFATDNIEIFIYNLSKLDNLIENNDNNEEQIYSQINIDFLKEKVQSINTTPTQIKRNITVYSRNNALRALVKIRSNYSCEMPECNYIGFEKDNGEKYIEVHHLTPLSVGGEDSLSNTVALCPTCHRKMHYANNKEELKILLEDYINCLN